MEKSFKVLQQKYIQLARVCDFEKQDPELWQGKSTLPSIVVQYYQELGPLQVAFGMRDALFFPSLVKLWHFQHLYGYDPVRKQLRQGWNEDWLVLARHFKQPIIVSRSTQKVLYYNKLTGEVDYLFDDLYECLHVLALLSSVVKDAKGRLFSTEKLVHPSFAEHAFMQVSELYASLTVAEHKLKVLGWF